MRGAAMTRIVVSLLCAPALLLGALVYTAARRAS